MGNSVTTIIDALRRLGSRSQRNAIARQDAQLEGQSIVRRGREFIAGGETLRATLEPWPETIASLDPAELLSIRRNAARAPHFLACFLAAVPEQPGPDEFDDAFSKWQVASDQLGFDDHAVVQILGAAFGDYCASRLDMRWVLVTDHLGSAVALTGIEHQFRAFPFHSVDKRVKAREHRFFRSVFALLEHDRTVATPVAPVSPPASVEAPQ